MTYNYKKKDKTVLLDASAFRDYFDKKGLLFHPTKGTLNDSCVRLRENPNLEAKHLGFLNKGDKVKVLDRSGIKVQIREMNDYWYKVKTEDGTVGWAYGHFINPEEKQ